MAPRSQQTGLTRRLSIDGPTEASLTPLEILAKETVPRYKPDTSFFGTPRSRQLENQTPLEMITATLKTGAYLDKGFEDYQPVERTRHQRMQDKKPSSGMGHNHQTGGSLSSSLGHDQQAGGPRSRDYSGLPGVRTGTTAVGLVEHRNNQLQPLFHVPIFTTPIPKNGQFISLHQNPLRKLQTSLRNITSAISKGASRLPSPMAGLAQLKTAIQSGLGGRQSSLGGPRSSLGVPKSSLGGRNHHDIQITPAPKAPAIVTNFQEVPRQRKSGVLGRRLDTFSRYTKMANFRSSGDGVATSLIMCLTLATVHIYRVVF